MPPKPFAESCEQNREPILAVIRPLLRDAEVLLELGSGTGQHAVFFAAAMPHLRWQTSERAEHHPGILAWLAEGPPNALAPLTLDVRRDPWPSREYDAIFSANTLHIMSGPEVEALFAGAGGVLRPGGRLLVYGPFNYDGEYSSESNARFDRWLKGRDPRSGIKDLGWLEGLATGAGMALEADHPMPVNNRLLVWCRGR